MLYSTVSNDVYISALIANKEGGPLTFKTLNMETCEPSNTTLNLDGYWLNSGIISTFDPTIIYAYANVAKSNQYYFMKIQITDKVTVLAKNLLYCVTSCGPIIFLENNTILTFVNGSYGQQLSYFLYDQNLNIISNKLVPYDDVSNIITLGVSPTNLFIGANTTLYQFDINDFSKPQFKINTEFATFNRWNTMVARTNNMLYITNASSFTVYDYNPSPPQDTSTAGTTSTIGTTSGSTVTTSPPLGLHSGILSRKKYGQAKQNVLNGVRRTKVKNGIRLKDKTTKTMKYTLKNGKLRLRQT